MSIQRILVLVTAALAVVVVLAPTRAWAPVPPRNCGMLAEGGKRYNIKADQLRCPRARKYSRRYLASHDRPRGYSCKDYGRGTSIKFRCAKGNRVTFFAIRR